MDVKIDSRLVVAEREARAWSQQHLADASGLALRTIQRIEARGAGSYESAKAIAACFAMPVASLRAVEKPVSAHFVRSRAAKLTSAALASLGMAAAALFLSDAYAQRVILEVGVTEEEHRGATPELGVDERKSLSRFSVDSGEERELPMEEEFRLVVSPNILADGQVYLIVRFYQYRNQDYELVGEPRVVTRDGEQVEVEVLISEEPRHAFRVAITPQLL